jgi:L-rhamnonate dehydratase
MESLDIWQPEITWCGGLTAGRRILYQARTAGIPGIPHSCGEVRGLHMIAASDCADLGEVLPGRRGVPQDQLWLVAPKPVTGYLTPHDTPGFGVRINEMLIG